MRIRKNARNVVIITPPVVIKYPRDGNIARVFKEFALAWKAFLNGLAPLTLLIGPFLLQQRVPILLKHLSREEILARAGEIIGAIEKLSSARIEHRELRHPESHIGFLGRKVVFLDFDHARLSERSRDLNKFLAWLDGVKKLARR